MTENKRFRYVEANDVDEHIIDYSTEPHFEYYTLKGATDKLNELNNENKRLKKQRDCIYGDLTRLKKDYLELTDENKNLKAQNKLIKMEIAEMRKLWGSK